MLLRSQRKSCSLGDRIAEAGPPAAVAAWRGKMTLLWLFVWVASSAPDVTTHHYRWLVGLGVCAFLDIGLYFSDWHIEKRR